tara:strand:+ start:589 stop:771 length:183 start_codon:yes stop_codon:yes gene_type:complete
MSRFGNVKYATIRRDFNALRVAIRLHDPLATEAAWEKCERWLESVPNCPEPLIDAAQGGD